MKYITLLYKFKSIQNDLTYIYYEMITTIKKTIIFLLMRKDIRSIIFISAIMLTIVIMLYITFLALIYSITENLYILTTFIQSSSPHLVITNSISFTMSFCILFTVDTIASAPQQPFPWPGGRAMCSSYNGLSYLSDVVCLCLSLWFTITPLS